MSELSISQTSDAPTESSKSSTGEIPEELCNLPLDATTIREEQDKEEIETKIIKNEPVIAVCVIPEKSEIDLAKSASKEETSKKPTEIKSKVESTKVQSKQESKDSKPVPKSESTVSHKGTKTQDPKPDIVTKKNETNVSKTNQSKNVTSGTTKGKAPEVKAKENEKTKPSVEIVTEPTISVAPVTPEAEKVSELRSLVFNIVIFINIFSNLLYVFIFSRHLRQPFLIMQLQHVPISPQNHLNRRSHKRLLQSYPRNSQ